MLDSAEINSLFWNIHGRIKKKVNRKRIQLLSQSKLDQIFKWLLIKIQSLWLFEFDLTCAIIVGLAFEMMKGDQIFWITRIVQIFEVMIRMLSLWKNIWGYDRNFEVRTQLFSPCDQNSRPCVTKWIFCCTNCRTLLKIQNYVKINSWIIEIQHLVTLPNSLHAPHNKLQFSLKRIEIFSVFVFFFDQHFRCSVSK